ncbi:hypothetical protein [Planococcus beigongshangi]|uniref:hypothetical protein n=1 Tax=Planococcus beigongshangi TaxID=2782536 RepID=UPI00193C5F2B|nr:hypothetical protein [Planococcus beigongshangi]
MEYVIKTQQGIDFTLSPENANLDAFIEQFNNMQLTAVSLSNIGMNKRNIIAVAPKVPFTKTGAGIYKLNTVDGSEYLVKLEENDSVSKVVGRINDHKREFIKVGDAESAVIIPAQNFDFIIETTALGTPAA